MEMIRAARNLINIALKPRTASSLPIYLHVEPTNRCHLACIGCARDVVLEGSGDMPFDAYTRLIDDVKPQYVALNGIGEPVLHPRFFDMVRYAKARGAQVNTCSSMVLKAADFEEFVLSGLDLLKVSLDGATPATYQKLRGRDLHGRVLEGVAAVAKARQRHGIATPALRFNCLLVEDTLHEMEALIVLARELGVPAVIFQPLESSSVEVRTRPLIENVDYDGFRALLVVAARRADELKVETNLDDLIGRFPVYWGKYRQDDRVEPDTTVCPMPWYSLYVNASGVAQPCCKFSRYGETHGALGNIVKDGPAAVWNGEAMQRLRDEFKHGVRRNQICQECVALGPRAMVKRLAVLPSFSTSLAGAGRGR